MLVTNNTHALTDPNDEASYNLDVSRAFDASKMADPQKRRRKGSRPRRSRSHLEPVVRAGGQWHKELSTQTTFLSKMKTVQSQKSLLAEHGELLTTQSYTTISNLNVKSTKNAATLLGCAGTSL